MEIKGLMRCAVLVGVVSAALAGSACQRRASQVPPRDERSVAWRQLGSWSGRGSLQTESFTSDTGTLRVRWEATAPAAPDTSQTTPGNFRLEARSAISGRLLEQVVDHAGAGHGIGYVQQDPHVFYVVVESTRVNWRFTVEEAVGFP